MGTPLRLRGAVQVSMMDPVSPPGRAVRFVTGSGRRGSNRAWLKLKGLRLARTLRAQRPFMAGAPESSTRLAR